METIYYTIPIISGFIGWITNCLAIKMIFRPYNPVNILGLKFQGLVPKRKPDLAKKISATVSEHLLSHDDILKNISGTKFEDGFKEVIDDKLEDFIQNKLFAFSPLIANFLDNSIKDKIKGLLVEEVVDLLPELSEKITEKFETSFDMKKIIEGRINAFDMRKLESIILDIASRELKAIEVLGGILGFVIGVVQLFILSI